MKIETDPNPNLVEKYKVRFVNPFHCDDALPTCDAVQIKLLNWDICNGPRNPRSAVLQVYGLPTLMLFKDGKVVEGSHSEGAVSKKSLASYMSQYGIEANTAL